MADIGKFPGTGMEVFTKYPDSYRLDHPNYGDVAKTTYAVGKITDFEMLYFYPFRVKSMVKVSGDWGESGYLPLFYHPKPRFWDDPNGALATDYNVPGGYFEKAWMSFRVGDEVKVMLKEGVPVAVVGFADDVPRIGENLVQMKTYAAPGTAGFNATLLFQFDPPGVYFIDGPITSPSYPSLSSSKKGPDGLDLKLLEPPILIREVHYGVYGGGHSNEYDQFVVIGPILYIFCHWYGDSLIGETVRAALYTPELLESLSNYPMPTEFEIFGGMYFPFNGTRYPGTYLQNEFLYMMGTVQHLGSSWLYGFSHDLTVRPHTKQKMMKYGIWPA